MKITVNFDVTPQEARAFFGLPDVKPLQDEMLGKIRDKMRAGAEGFDPVTLMKPFMPDNMQTLDALQKSFWRGLTGAKTPPPPAKTKAAKASPAKKT